MISPIEMYMADCDVCKKRFETYEGYMCLTDKDGLINNLQDSGWFVEGNIIACPDCHSIDDNDDVILKINSRLA